MTGLAMKVDPSHAGELVHSRAPRATAATSGASFATALADARAPIEPRPGETLRPVPGHAYAEIRGGSRDGMYVNTSANERRGEAFAIAIERGVEYHIYGHGKQRTAVPVTERDVEPRHGETLEPVSARPYAEIHGGARDGLYLNTSDNERRGRAFALVRRHGIEYHVYGHGDDRLVVAVKPPHRGVTA